MMNSNRNVATDSSSRPNNTNTNNVTYSPPRGTGGEEEAALTSYEQERQSYFRIIRYTIFLLIFWVIVLWLTEHHDDGVAWFLLGLLGLWFLYMIVYICMVLCSIRSLAARVNNASTNTTRPSNNNDGVLLVGDNDNDSHDGIIQDDDDDDDDNDPTRLLKYGFDETPERIRKCQQPKTPNIYPRDGIYTVVFSAIYFGKALRSETKLKLKFHATKEDDSGWEITGLSGFQQGRQSLSSTPIDEGFINTKGEMYWVTSNSTYRGILDWGTLTMFDGEFLSKKAGNTKGRVVRLEYDKAATTKAAAAAAAESTTSITKDIEMSSIGNGLV